MYSHFPTNALNRAAIVIALQRANYASEAGAHPCVGAYADRALWLGVVPSRQADLPTTPSIRRRGARSTSTTARSSIYYAYNPSPST